MIGRERSLERSAALARHWLILQYQDILVDSKNDIPTIYGRPSRNGNDNRRALTDLEPNKC